jgi:YVTN family beta-propeller protein
VDNANGKFAYVTIGGENKVKVYRRGGTNPRPVATIPVGDLPHGVWGSGDGTRVYVGLENQDAVTAIDALTNKAIATIPIGQQPMALVYVPRAVPSGDGTANLTSRGWAGKAGHLTMTAPPGGGHQGHATVSVNAMGPLDTLEIAASGLSPGKVYTLWLVTSQTPPFGHKQELADFKTNIAGTQIAQAIGPLREVLTPGNAGQDRQRYLLVTLKGSDTPVLVQKTP